MGVGAYVTLSNYYLIGYLTEIRIWDEVRNASQIKANYNKRLTGQEPHLRVYYPMDENTANIYDHTQNKNHGAAIVGTTSVFDTQPLDEGCAEQE